MWRIDTIKRTYDCQLKYRIAINYRDTIKYTLYNERSEMMKKLLLLLCISSSCLAAEPTMGRQTEIRTMLKNTCASCHGANLQGAMGPSLQPTALASKADAMLIDTIYNGRKGTMMMSWKASMNQDEITWLVGILKSGK